MSADWDETATSLPRDEKQEKIWRLELLVDDLAEALSMIASEETAEPVKFAAQVLASHRLYTTEPTP